MNQVDWIIIGVLLLLGLILPKRKNTEKADRNSFIENNGFQYEEIASPTRLKKLHLWGFKLLLKGDNEEVTKLMFKKDNNLDLFIFEYKYQGIFDGPTNNSAITYSYQKRCTLSLSNIKRCHLTFTLRALLKKLNSLFFQTISILRTTLFFQNRMLYMVKMKKQLENFLQSHYLNFYNKIKAFQ